MAAAARSSAVTYAITAGNADGTFAIDSCNGAITVTTAQGYETTASCTLTVKPGDGNCDH